MRQWYFVALLGVFAALAMGAAEYPIGDLNADRKVDFADVQFFAGSWLNEECRIVPCEADLDGVGGVTWTDFTRLAANWRTDWETPVINEFMASNGSRLPLGEGDILDSDGDSSDWIELYNPTERIFDLGGWYLTDDADNLTQWQFPKGTLLGPHAYLVVFASGKNRLGGELHTNFRLAVDGGYVALVKDDGRTVAHEYGPSYPEQLTDISYGLGQHDAQFIDSGSMVLWHVPGAEDAGRNWTAVEFDDDNWSTAAASLGFSPTSQLFGRDIGGSSTPGGHMMPSPTAFVVYGDGADIGGTADAFYYFYMPLRGDGELTARVLSVTDTSSQAKAGLMIRETLAAGSRHAMEAVTPSGGTIFQQRAATGGPSESTAGATVQKPQWIRIVRRGNTFSGYYSVNGATWVQHGTGTISMAQDAYIGMCVTSRATGVVCAGVFDNVAFGGQASNLLRDRMLGVNASVWMRARFDAEETDFFDSLRLHLRYEDGFVAWLNGVEVARANVTGAPRWDSVSDIDRPDLLMGEPDVLDLSRHAHLLRDGQNVLAIQGLNDGPADPTFLMAPELDASSEVRVPQYFATATPGRANVSGDVDIVATPEPSHPRGLYAAPFSLAISCDTPGAAIRYTTDGTKPSQVSGQTYAGPIPISVNTCLRVAAFKAGWMPSAPHTYTYIFPDQVQKQSKNPPGFPASWGYTSGDYEMDPDIVNNAAYRPHLTAALRSLPAMSLVMNLNDLFGAGGIYTNWNSSGDAWERPGSVEMIYPDDPDGNEGFHVDCGVRIYGGVGRRELKKSFRLQFTRRHGPAKLRYPLFGDGAADEFDQLILRANFNDAYTWGGDRSQYIRDEYVRRIQLALGDPSPHGNFVHLYINGAYWGLYNVTERPEASFAATYFGGDKEDWDALNSGRPLGSSSTATWNAMLNMSRQGMETNAAYQRLQGNNPDGTPNPQYVDYLDIDNYINYMILNFFVGNRDWPGHNWYAAMNRVNPSGWKSFSWDAEWVVGMNSGVNDNITGVNSSLCEPYARLRANPEFCLRFADLAHKAFFNDGPLYVDPQRPQWDRTHPERNRPAALYAELADWIEQAMLGESARWGDAVSGSPYRIEQWRSQRDWVLNTYMPQRAANVLNQLRDAGLYPTVAAPVFHINGLPRHGGSVPSNSLLTMGGAPANVYYTVDGSDPRLPASMSDDGKTVTLVAENAPKRVLVPSVANGGNLLSNLPAGFQVTFYKANVSVGSLAAAEGVIANPVQQANVVREQAQVINYFNTGSPGNFDKDKPFPGTAMNADVEDFVILATAKVIIPAVGNWTFGVNSDDGFGLTLSRGGRTYTSSYPDPRGPGDTLKVFNIAEAGPHDLRLVFYERGGGSELELFAARGSLTSFSASQFRLVGDMGAGGLQVGEGSVWFASTFNDAAWTPGTGGVGYEASTGNYPTYFSIDVRDDMHNKNGSCYIRIPFVVTKADFSNMVLKVRYDDGFVAYLNGAEVARRNFTGDPQWNSVAGATNADEAAVVPASIDISGHVGVLWEGVNMLAIHGLNTPIDSSDFLISVELVAGEMSRGAVSPLAISYAGPVQLTESARVRARTFDGRWSALNEAVFSVGPVVESLRISEIMYHPLDTGDPSDPNTEYIELTNIGSESINLNFVRFTDGVDFTFPSFNLAPGGYCLVVKDTAAFEGRYGPGLPVLGRYTGSLNNAGERIELQDAVGTIIHDFQYDDDWFDITDGPGFSLTARTPVTVTPNALGGKSGWRPSAHIGGSPGADDSGDVPELGSVVINEVLANSQGVGPDWIELYNTTDQTINIGGWFLSDDADDLMKYEIAAGTSIAAGEYIVFYEDRHLGNIEDPGCHTPFALSADGETVYLHSGSEGVLTGYSEQEKFDASEPGVSLGRWQKSTGTHSFVALSEPTPGWANAEPHVNTIVINEIMYHPDAPADAEYVELLNVSGGPATLYDAPRGMPWRFTDDPDNPGIEFLFPADPPVTLAPGEYLLLVKDVALFQSRYAAPADVQTFAWGQGSLANGSERVQLSKPGDMDADGTRNWIRVDRVAYSDGSHPEDFPDGVDPWPAEADGGGMSLSRIDADAYGSDASNWRAATPSPGQVN